MRPLQRPDLFQVDELLTDQEKTVRDTVASRVVRRVMPHVEEWAWESAFPCHLAPDTELLGAPYPDVGLPGLGAVANGRRG